MSLPDHNLLKRKNYSSGGPWEDILGSSRAVRVGDLIEVGGTTAARNGEVVGVGNAFEQARFIFNLIERVLSRAGTPLEAVTRTRIYLTNIDNWEDVAKAHNLFFSDIKPVCTVLQVSALLDPEMLVEVEVTAVHPTAKTGNPFN
ncbi:MAG: RidA family protein [Saprospiraceae bacterium]